jgi:hypothetical protein
LVPVAMINDRCGAQALAQQVGDETFVRSGLVRAVCTAPGQGTNEMVAPTVKAVYEKHGGASGRGRCCHSNAPLYLCVLMTI